MEVAQLWGRLNTRYDTIEFTSYMANYAKDPDFKAIIAMGQAMLKKHAAELEETMLKFGLPLPARPPAGESTAKPIDAITDQYIFRHILKGIQSYLPINIAAFQNSSTPSVRKRFKSLLTEELDIYRQFFTYGQLKGWTYKPPSSGINTSLSLILELKSFHTESFLTKHRQKPVLLPNHPMRIN